MNARSHNFPDFARRPGDETLAQIVAFADTLDETDPLYWPALAASDGCEASLRELNAMLIEDDCYPFVDRSVVGMIGGAL